MDYLTEIIKENKERYFVGELAVKEGKKENLMTTFNRERYKHITYDVLVLTATRLLVNENEKEINLAVGLPVSYFKQQKDELKKKLEQVFAKVSVNNNKHLPINFRQVIVYPQGAGALLTVSNLPDDGRILIIDIGQ
ncbi:ParM/StbA family protein [Peptococcaceae bacterium]|nr:ParM/StbA family protein [Peptococcaceae bacterium]MCL0041979.1 ParM/StbA family protein [Peptococcaceae bacterium]MCL0077605.1 ParM/StbA family protein [Peptococcaceae bacterium]